GGEGTPVGGAVDTEGKAAGDHQSAAGELGGKGAGILEGAATGAAAADDGQLGQRQQVHRAAHIEQGRGTIDFTEQRRVAGVAQGQQVDGQGRQPGGGDIGPALATSALAPVVAQGLIE